VTSTRQTLPLVEEEAPFQKTQSLQKKIWLWGLTGHETKIDFAGDDQQQFTRPTKFVFKFSSALRLLFMYSDCLIPALRAYSPLVL
jgi:hypothetical protein